jgi:hypothetical protein
MTMMDAFDRFENGIGSWIRNRSILWIVPIKIIVIWVAFSLALAGMCGIVGFNMVANNITEQYDAGLYPQDSYDMWQNVLVPVAVQAFNTIGWLVILIAGFYIVLMLYLIVKVISRRYSDHQDN